MSRQSGFNDSIGHVDDLEAGNITASNRSDTADFDRKYFRALSNDSFVVIGAGHVPTVSSSSMNSGDESEHENASVWSSQHFRSNHTFLAMASSGINFDMDNDDEDITDECPLVGEKASSVPTCATIPGTNSKFSAEKFTSAMLYGVINLILTIPFTYGYAAIIFSHPNLATFMSSLSKLVMLSNVVHQVMFTLLSSLPFAIGQVQDVRLIFLSAMATSICNSLGPDVSLEAKVATVVVTIGIATAALGLCLVLSFREYVMLWLSFIAVNGVSLELGMLLGVGFPILNFLFGYVLSMRFVTRNPHKSLAAVRKYAARAVINQKRDAIAYLELCGHLFFDSSAQILRDAQKEIVVRKKSSSCDDSNTSISKSSLSKTLKRFLSTLYGHFGDRRHSCQVLTSTPVTSSRNASLNLECLDGSSPSADIQPHLLT